MKAATIVVLLVAAAFAMPLEKIEENRPREICNATSDHDLTKGCTNLIGGIVLRKTITEPSKLFEVTTHTLKYPEYAEYYIITCIRVRDLLENGHGGCPDIIAGGTDFYEVTLKFASQRSREMKFYVEIYGTK